ncbi:cornulin-like [Elgaria multicarinata webbii]|uniref:cornulin-like n=1 Tax=Elgaria multicarinata webbii TaxID=159646 RepID=UPI002FCCCE10
MSQLLSNINGIISAFDKYAKQDGDCATLSKGELKQLIQKEFVDVIVNPYDPETIETMLQLLDTDSDGKVDFEEFTVLVFKVAKACYKKVSDCRAPAEGHSGKTGSGTTQQDWLRKQAVNVHMSPSRQTKSQVKSRPINNVPIWWSKL